MFKKISIVWLIAAAIVLLGLLALDVSRWVSDGVAVPLKLYSGLTLVASAIAFVQFGWDKRMAQTKSWRVPENTLLLSALICGWPGAILGQEIFRHKTQKQPFGNILYGISVIHLLLPFVFGFAVAFGVI